MRIVQTFWSGERSLLTEPFGWIDPQSHLMSWALSCLSLREHYEEVVLYTDSEGYKVLIEQLKLPYSDVVVEYDNLNCPRPHWAYPKLLTYSLQTVPFIHVDGDVYLPRKLSSVVEESGLIAQNREIGSEYYKNMMTAILQNDISIPCFLRQELEQDSISSYNAGIIGGNDLDFIKEYCRTAFEFIETNSLNDIGNPDTNVNYNILFEQILFYVLSARYSKSVATVVDHNIRDNGYTYREFCDFYQYDKVLLMHILGGHKKNQRVCELLAKTLLDRYPEYYRNTMQLFPITPGQQCGKTLYSVAPDLPTQMCISSYRDFSAVLSARRTSFSDDELFQLEKKLCAYPCFLNAEEKEKHRAVLEKNPYLSIYEIRNKWTSDAKRQLKERVCNDYPSDNFDIACVPNLSNGGINEVLIDDLAYNILILLEEERTFVSLLYELKQCFKDNAGRNQELHYKAILITLEYLFYNKLIYIKTI